jgi:hypothetical protein
VPNCTFLQFSFNQIELNLVSKWPIAMRINLGYQSRASCWSTVRAKLHFPAANPIKCNGRTSQTAILWHCWRRRQRSLIWLETWRRNCWCIKKRPVEYNCELPRYSTALPHLQQKPSICANPAQTECVTEFPSEFGETRIFGKQRSKPQFSRSISLCIEQDMSKANGISPNNNNNI